MKSSKNYISAFIVISMLFMSFSNAFAFSDNHKKAANDLLNTMNINELLAQSIEAMMQLELSNNASLRPFESTMRDFFNKYMSGESLRENFIKLYAETFSEKELMEIDNFYKTPTGQKALRTAPNLMAKGAALGQQRVQENIPELQSMIEKEAERIQKLQQQSD